MPRFAANLSMMFGEVDFLDRFEAAAEAGFSGVEYLFPYDYDAEALAERLQRHGLTQVLHNLPAGDWAAGERGIACLPGREGEFQAGVEQAIDYARALGCRQVNCLAGIAPADADPEELTACFVENLRFASDKLSEAGIRLLIEPINTRDIPGFFLTGTKQALALIDALGHDKLALQYDVYHMQIMEGDLARTIADNRAVIEHVQIADNPGRHEPGTGEINYGFLFEHLDRIGYSGWVGCEYKPLVNTVQGLSWMADHRDQG